MRSWYRTALLLFLLFPLLGGCAYVASLQGDLDQRVDAWAEQKQYGKALAALSYVRPDHPQYQALKAREKRIRRAANVYAKQQARRGGELTRQGRWSQALALYRDALERVPDNPLLEKGLADFRARQRERLDGLRLDLLLSRAQWLAQSLPIRRAITETDAEDRGAAADWNDSRAEAERVATELTRRGTLALKTGDLDTASNTLHLAARLSSSAELEAALKQMKQAEAAESREARAARLKAAARRQQKVVDETRAAFDDAYANHRLREARDLIGQLRELEPDNEEYQRLGAQVRQTIDSTIKQRMQKGGSLYSSGRFEEALANWHAVLKLDPDNDKARANVERAERVLERLRELRQKQEGIVPTAAPAGGN